jgi:hypothetical protein
MANGLPAADLASGDPFHLPRVYVSEPTTWSYKRVIRNLAKENALDEEELNRLGAEGWELTGILSDSPFVYFYLKRLEK